MSKSLTAAAISAAIDAMPKNYFTMPHAALGGDVNIKIDTCAEREEFEQIAYGTDSEYKKYPQRALVFAHAVVDENGKRLFTLDQVEMIAEWPAHITVPVFTKYNEINSLGVAKVDAAEKN